MIPLLTEQENTLPRPRGSIVQTSHQSWKLFGGFIVLFGGFVAMAYGLAHLQDRDGFAITLAGIAVGLGGPISAALSIRCQACGARWLWLAVGTQEHSRWLNWLSTQTVCPRCGDDPAKREPSDHQ